MSEPEARIYGMADEENHQTPAPGGVRGEGAPIVDDPELRHDVTAGGRKVTVQESSGVAFVEASGAPGPVKSQDKPVEDEPDADGNAL
jgi:hypothetical protein